MQPISGNSQRPLDLTLLNWDRAPYNRWSFRHMREVVRTAPVAAGVPMPLTPAKQGIDPDAVVFIDHAGAPTTVGRLLDATNGNYQVLFAIASVLYLVGLAIMHLILPKTGSGKTPAGIEV